MKPLIKICGITNEKDALFCSEMGANFLGFNFYKQSPRYIEPSNAARIIHKLSSSINPVGIFVNENRERIERIITRTGIRLLQLSGDESPKDCSGYQIPVWKTFRIRNRDEVSAVQQYSIAAVMLDGAKEKFGGSGELADFSIATEMKKYHKLVLAGGLNPENVLDAVKNVQPYAIDINSGVELEPGKKDQRKVFALFKQLSNIS